MEQIEESAATPDPASEELERYVASMPGMAQTGLATMSVTGARVLDVPDAMVSTFPAAELGYQVMTDLPLSLIRPVRAAGLGTTSLAGVDPWHLANIGLEAARGAGSTLTGKDVTVAVMDTGVDATHPEIDGRVISSHRVDPAYSSVLPSPDVDTDGHGTHVSGLIAGRNVGIAPDANLINLIMIPGGNGMLSDFLIALEWAAANPDVQIINMSAGIPGMIPGFDDVLQQVQASGVLLVCAVGNDGRDHSRSPGNYRDVLSVGAVDRNNAVASFSGGGRVTSPDGHTYTVPDLVAPGAAVFSCVMGGGYEAWDGTSMATPIVTGIAALMLERDPLIQVADLTDRVLSACRDLGVIRERQGAGLAQI